MSQSNTNSSGIGFAGLLTIVFITLKLIGYIHWPWWWVLAPMWIAAILWVVIVGGTLIFLWIID